MYSTRHYQSWLSDGSVAGGRIANMIMPAHTRAGRAGNIHEHLSPMPFWLKVSLASLAYMCLLRA